jgi:trehalose 6-phosphate synthase/phosphatase
VVSPKEEGRGERPLVIASNRLPFTVHRGPGRLERRPSPGGLVSALEPVLRKHGGTWVGWPGVELRRGEHIATGGKPYRISPVLLSDSEVARYYHGFSNRTLWPLFHSMPGRTRFDAREWESYERVNQRFAETVLAEEDRTELVWIHDYHLLLVPERVRYAMSDAHIGFFLHIPFPPYDIFRLLPWDRQILRGLLGCDLIGFHVEGYARNFLDCVERTGARVDRNALRIEHGDRTVQVGIFPIGIEFSEFEARARGAPSRGRRAGGEKIVLGVDRLDYTKGIPERILAFERLLEKHPRHREEVVLMQIAVPSRSQVGEYRALKREIDELVGRTNGRFATANWSPIRYLYRSFHQEKLAAIYRDADVALLTPLRDGMNLVAKEYVACQVDEPGVLILSRLAGVAETMHEAILVNPYDIEGTAEAIHRALIMDEAERRLRIAALRHTERRNDINRWVESFLQAAVAARTPMAPLTDADFERWLGAFLGSYRLALFLDYDGTLTPLVSHPSDARLSPEMRRIIERCAGRADTDVAIVSGRALTDVRRLVDHPRLLYAGNHGLEMAGAGFPDFRHEDLIHYSARTEELAKTLEEVAEKGAWTELKGPTLTFHYRAVPEDERAEIVERAREIIGEAGYHARDAHCAVEGRPPIGWDKGRAVLHVLRSRYGPSWSEQVRAVYMGDDHTDEDAFRLLAGLGVTFRIGPADTLTAATRRLPHVEAVGALLDWLARRPVSTP